MFSEDSPYPGQGKKKKNLVFVLLHFPKQMWVFCCPRASQSSQAKGSDLPLGSSSDKLLPWHQYHELMVPLRIFFFPFCSLVGEKLLILLEQMFLVPMATNRPPFLMAIFLVKDMAQPLPYQSRVCWWQAPHWNTMDTCVPGF